MDEEGHILPIGETWNRDVTDDVTGNVTKNVTGNVTQNVTNKTSAEKRRDEILRLMEMDKKITFDYLANTFNVSRMTIARDIELLRSQNKLMRDGDNFGGNGL